MIGKGIHFFAAFQPLATIIREAIRDPYAGEISRTMKRAGGCSGNMRVRSGVLCLFEDQKKKALLRKIIE